MAKVSVLNMEGSEVGTIELNDAVFGVEVNENLVHQAVVNQLANNRQGTQKAKTKMNKKEKRIALKSALTSRVNEGKLIVVDELKFDAPKTKEFAKVMANLKAEKALVVLSENDANTVKSAKNIPTVKTALTNTINVYDILKYDTLVVEKAAVATIEEVYA